MFDYLFLTINQKNYIRLFAYNCYFILMGGHSTHYETRYYESAESIRIREQQAKEEKDKEAASK